MIDAPRVIYPVYMFERRQRDENSARVLAGSLHLNNFGQRRLSHRARRELAEIIRNLTEDARAGRLPPDGIKIGWPVGLPPVNAADVTDEAIMRPWRRRRAFAIFVRVGADGEWTITRERDHPMRT
jgi:hypothetical protein